MTSTVIRTALEAALGCALTEITGAGPYEYHNTHYRGVLRDGTGVFVKLLSDDPGYYRAEVRAADHLAGTAIPAPSLICHGVLDEKHRWLAFEWRDLERFTPTPRQVAFAGELLGKLHAVTRGASDPQIRQYASVDALIAGKTAQVARIDVALADRIQRLHDAITSQGSTDPGVGTCLLHGDVGWRNFYTDPGDQRIWIVDFEHAAIGPPLLDFAKLWDRELADPATRAAFLNGYSQHQPGIAATPASINAVRLWAAAGIIPYARPRGDHDFEQHAHLILRKLEKGE